MTVRTARLPAAPSPCTLPRMTPVESYLADLSAVRSAGTAETSGYPALANLINAIGDALKPKIRAVTPFIAEFDPELRKQFGVWYTPPEIVKYLVARVDRTWQENFGSEHCDAEIKHQRTWPLPSLA